MTTCSNDELRGIAKIDSLRNKEWYPIIKL
jgi:hypothetical protein